MNCQEIIPLLSPFHDSELSPSLHQAVGDHVSHCAYCSRKLDSLRKLSVLVEQARSPAAPSTLLAKVESSLNEAAFASAKSRSRVTQRSVMILIVATAAAVLGGVLIWRLGGEPSHSHVEMVQVFGQFLRAYEERSTSAINLLSQRYNGVLIDEAEATIALKRPTVARESVLSDHKVVSRYLLKMPCCDCVQTIYERNGEISFVVFEHERQELEWFDERPSTQTQCSGKQCCVVELKRGVAASWPVDSGFVTVIGIRDTSELELLVKELQPLRS
jgi:hypothetical protein